MIKIVKADYLDGYRIRLTFSDGKSGVQDFSYLLEKETLLTVPLRESSYFQKFFLELGALCWKDGLELGPQSLYEKMDAERLLEPSGEAA